MKKFISILISICMLYTSVNAISVSSYEELGKDYTPLIEPINEESDLYREYATKLKIARINSKYACMFEVNGELYCFRKGHITEEALPVKLSGEYMDGPNVIWTGEYYYTRSTELDGYWYNASKYAEPLILFYKDGNIVKQYDLKNTYEAHATKIGYLNGTYYCELSSNIIIKSTNFENWEKTDESVPQKFSDVMLSDGKVSFDKQNFSSVNYENDLKYRRIYSLGEWLVYCDEDTNFYFSNDGIYFVKVDYPPEMLEYDKENNYAYYGCKVYEYGDEIICDMNRTHKIFVYGEGYSSGYGYVRYKIPKNEVYQKLDELKSATHVKLNDEYLGFEVPPVTESDRTLVPMRFLFEQMGAEVTWNNDTQTATATLSADSGANGGVQIFGLAREKSVTFGIDDTTAVVNGESEEMDVPARLVDGKTMVPLRFLSENLGYNVEWDENTNTAIVTTK